VAATGLEQYWYCPIFASIGYRPIFQSAVISGVVVGREDVATFRQTTANFRQRRLWAHRISILPPDFPKMGFLAPNFALLDTNFRTRKFSDSSKFMVGNCVLGTLSGLIPTLISSSCTNSVEHHDDFHH